MRYANEEQFEQEIMAAIELEILFGQIASIYGIELSTDKGE